MPKKKNHTGGKKKNVNGASPEDDGNNGNGQTMRSGANQDTVATSSGMGQGKGQATVVALDGSEATAPQRAALTASAGGVLMDLGLDRVSAMEKLSQWAKDPYLTELMRKSGDTIQQLQGKISDFENHVCPNNASVLQDNFARIEDLERQLNATKDANVNLQCKSVAARARSAGASEGHRSQDGRRPLQVEGARSPAPSSYGRSGSSSKQVGCFRKAFSRR
jgi:hypothetical protein